MLTIRTGRLILVAIDPGLADAQAQGADVLAACIGANPPSAWPPEPFDAEVTQWSRDGLARDPGAIGWYGWLMLEDQGEGAPPALVGAAGLIGPPDLEGETELGFGMLDEFRGRGLGALAVAALTRWALSHGARTVVAHVPADQENGLRALRDNGFSAEPAPYPGVARYVRAATSGA